MSEETIPCCKNLDLTSKIEELKSAIRTKSHTLVNSGLSEEAFYSSGVLRAAIESLRGSNSAEMKDKRQFASSVLDSMTGRRLIQGWSASGSSNRFDYEIKLINGRICVVELKGCLDGNNTTIFERPPHADEFIIWSVCQNPGSDPRKGIWSALHTRLSAEIISNEKRVDGLVVWDMLCGNARICPKLSANPSRATRVGMFLLPPPCIYLLPASIPSPRNNPQPRINSIEDVGFLNALSKGFKCLDSEIYSVGISVAHDGANLVRTTTITRGGITVRKSNPTAIKRK